MPRYYCEYCDVFLTHDALSVRRLHNSGFKHKGNVRSYYERFLPSEDGVAVMRTTKALFDRMGDNELNRGNSSSSRRDFNGVGASDHRHGGGGNRDRFRRGDSGGTTSRRDVDRSHRFEPYGARSAASSSQHQRRGAPSSQDRAEAGIAPSKAQLNEDTVELARTHGLKLPQYGSVNMIPQQQHREQQQQRSARGDISARATVHRPPPGGRSGPPGSVPRNRTAPPPAPIGARQNTANAASFVPPPPSVATSAPPPPRAAVRSTAPPPPPVAATSTQYGRAPPPVPSRPTGAVRAPPVRPPPVPSNPAAPRKAVAPPPLPPAAPNSTKKANPPPPPPKKET